MQINDLKNTYTRRQLNYFPGSGRLRYKIFSPFLKDLSGEKVIYHERFVAVVELSDVEVSPKRFMAVATIVTQIEQEGRRLILPRRPWKFGGTWAHMTCGGRHFHLPYANWSIWPEPDLVKTVEDYAAGGLFSEALKLTVFDEFE